MASVDVNDLNSEFARRMALLLRDAKAAGITGVTLSSGYRSNAEQAEIRARHEAMPGGVAAHPAAPAGASYHNYGFATDVSGKDLQKLKVFATAHPEYGITTNIKNDPFHFQLADTLADARANPPKLESGVNQDDVFAYLRRFTGGAPVPVGMAPGDPPAPASALPAGAPPAPNLGTTLTTPPPVAPDAAPAAPAAPADAPSAASLLGKGDVGGAFGAAMGNPLVKGGMDALGKGLSSKAPDMKPPEMPALQDNSAAIAEQAPQMMAALMAQIRARQQALQPQDGGGGIQVPGLTLNNRRRMF